MGLWTARSAYSAEGRVELHGAAGPALESVQVPGSAGSGVPAATTGMRVYVLALQEACFALYTPWRSLRGPEADLGMSEVRAVWSLYGTGRGS